MIKRTILVVDDQIVNRKILNRMFAADYEVLNAENGKEALELLHANEDISAVLLDIVMPVMDGYEVLKAMKDDPVLSKIPVIVSSYMDSEEAEVQALSLGAYDFIAKPYKPDIIRHRLKNTIQLRETAAMINKTERDELTGLYNKQFFLDKVREYLEKHPEERVDILCLGVERFKLVNDTYGEQVGDQVLCYIAGLLTEACKSIGICGRFSGDEFYALIPYKERRDREFLRSYYDKVNEFPIDMEIKLHCGIYTIHGDEKTITAACDRAKLAADANRGKYNEPFDYYDDSLRQKLMQEQFITSHMHSALEEQQFQVYYQPKYDLTSETIAGAEALVRWIHPEKGFLSPGAFIPIFEKNGFITQLDRYVWERVCRDIRAWLDAGFPTVAVSVNVSRADIYNPKLPDIILGLVAKYQIPLENLHLEITESAYTDNPDQIISVVTKLRDLGFVIEMDDFGSGYSSLNMLAKMPVDVLKLDMKFVQTESEVTSGKGIMSFVISLAKWLNLAVVAEGVETAEQIASLRSMDCNYVQGFYYAKPMPLGDFERLLTSVKTTRMVCSNQTMNTYSEKEQKLTRPSEGRQMLIVDDIEVNRAVLSACFMDEYVIVEKENGREAWEYIKENYKDIDVVMLDLLMPVMDGFQLLQKIRNEEAFKELPVMITSQGDAESERRALALQADDFISKPYKTDLIRHRVHNVISSHRYSQIEEQKLSALRLSALNLSEADAGQSKLSDEERISLYLQAQKPHFDIVRLVDPALTMVCENADGTLCDHQNCFSVWGKQTRCSNCISLEALEKKTRKSKLEYSGNQLFFVIAEYVPYKNTGAVVELVTRLENNYVDHIFHRDLLYRNIDEIHRQLECDELTGIFNRRHIDRHLENYVRNAKKRGINLGIAMVDVDSFKSLNDTYGHLAGDDTLKKVALILQNNIARSKGDFVARVGGDEFLIVCRDIPEEIFEKRLNAVARLVSCIEDELHKPGAVGISVGGVCTSDFPEFSVRELIARADSRLYRAKAQGKGCVVAAD